MNQKYSLLSPFAKCSKSRIHAHFQKNSRNYNKFHLSADILTNFKANTKNHSLFLIPKNEIGVNIKDVYNNKGLKNNNSFKNYACNKKRIPKFLKNLPSPLLPAFIQYDEGCALCTTTPPSMASKYNKNYGIITYRDAVLNTDLLHDGQLTTFNIRNFISQLSHKNLNNVNNNKSQSKPTTVDIKNSSKKKYSINKIISFASFSSAAFFFSKFCFKTKISFNESLVKFLAFFSPKKPLTSNYGDIADSQGQILRARWGKMFFGNIFHGPRNYPYRGSRYYMRRFSMKKHIYKKRWRRRRFKLAAIANLPHARMVRISMLPEIKSQKGGKSGTSGKGGGGGDVDADIAELISQAYNKTTSSTGRGRNKAQGTRSRPYSKYQV